MGIHGILKEIGAGQRISLAKFSHDHYSNHSRPLRLAIDISIWLFQIQSGKGGSNPALRTFYYRLLRLLGLNIHPLFVFDGPNKPLFKRNKRVGGPGVRVASVPEFLAKQLLKQFGFPSHAAPGEAEAECALLQREGIVDAVLSEDVDTMMFGSGVTLRNWTSENSSKSPSHVNVYHAAETEQSCGLNPEGMVLVALMSGGDYIPEGIPGCGPKLACDAARAGFGKDLCALGRKDHKGLQAWKERLQHQIRTNEAKCFSRRNPGLTIPEDFPSMEVLGYYTHPCVSSPEKLANLRSGLRWDSKIDFAALRSFAGDAFDWHCLGGAKKFIRNLAPVILVRELRLRGDEELQLEQVAQQQYEQQVVQAIHGKRNHDTTDGTLEYRISFIPSRLVPIDLSIEEEDDQFNPAGAVVADDDSDVDLVPSTFPPATQADSENESTAPTSPSKKRTLRPYEPSQPEKLWIMRSFLQIGCPLLIEDYEASLRNPKANLGARRKAQVAAKRSVETVHPASKAKTARQVQRSKQKPNNMPENSLMRYGKITKQVSTNSKDREILRESNLQDPGIPNTSCQKGEGDERAMATGLGEGDLEIKDVFKLPATQVPRDFFKRFAAIAPQPDDAIKQPLEKQKQRTLIDETSLPYTLSADVDTAQYRSQSQVFQRKQRECNQQCTTAATTPPRRKKRPSPEVCSPAGISQRTIISYYSPSPRKVRPSTALAHVEMINLVSSPLPVEPPVLSQQPTLAPTPPNICSHFVRSSQTSSLDLTPPPDFSPHRLPDSITVRRRKSPLKRWRTAPVDGTTNDLYEDLEIVPSPLPAVSTTQEEEARESRRESQECNITEITSSCRPVAADEDANLESPSFFVADRNRRPRRAQSSSMVELHGGGSDILTFVTNLMEDEVENVDLSLTPSKTPLPWGKERPHFPQREQHVEPGAEERLWNGGDSDPTIPVFAPFSLPEKPHIYTSVATTEGKPMEYEELSPPPTLPSEDMLLPLDVIVNESARTTAATTLTRDGVPHYRLSKRETEKQRKRIRLRDSLAGSWEEVAIDCNPAPHESVNLIGSSGARKGYKQSGLIFDQAGGARAAAKKNWRWSGVEWVDLTDA